MRKVFKHIVPICFLIGMGLVLEAQEKTITKEFKEATIERLSELMIDHYVFPEVAKETSEYLSEQWKAGHFDDFKTVDDFAEALTTAVQSINKDKHMRIRAAEPMVAKANTSDRIFEEHLSRMKERRNHTAGFREAKILDGNVGYFDIRSFYGVGIGSEYADSYMQLLSTADAIIVDLRNNGGGDPDMVQYLCSYFFDEKVHLNSLYFREGDRTIDFWVLEEVNGKKMPEVPLFVLVSDYTFSGAEEFSYNMQTQKRATLVGQTTRGGANPGGTMPINEQLSVFIPRGKAINPITKTNWEGVGVVPEVETATVEESFDKAYELAKVAAEKYSATMLEKQQTLLAELSNSLETFDAKEGEVAVYKSIEKCVKAGIMGEGMINGLGYDYLMSFEKPTEAQAIFKANTKLYPESANVFDSYAEALGMTGNWKEAVENYQMAVDNAKTNGDSNLELFKENLKKAKGKL